MAEARAQRDVAQGEAEEAKRQATEAQQAANRAKEKQKAAKAKLAEKESQREETEHNDSDGEDPHATKKPKTDTQVGKYFEKMQKQIDALQQSQQHQAKRSKQHSEKLGDASSSSDSDDGKEGHRNIPRAARKFALHTMLNYRSTTMSPQEAAYSTLNDAIDHSHERRDMTAEEKIVFSAAVKRWTLDLQDLERSCPQLETIAVFLLRVDAKFAEMPDSVTKLNLQTLKEDITNLHNAARRTAYRGNQHDLSPSWETKQTKSLNRLRATFAMIEADIKRVGAGILPLKPRVPTPPPTPVINQQSLMGGNNQQPSTGVRALTDIDTNMARYSTWTFLDALPKISKINRKRNDDVAFNSVTTSV